MLKVIPKDIKNIFIITLILGLVAFFLGLIIEVRYLYLGFSFGVLISLISNLILLVVSYQIAYRDSRLSLAVIRYICTYILYAIVLFLSVKMFNDKLGVIITALGLLSFKIVTNLYFFLSEKLLRK